MIPSTSKEEMIIYLFIYTLNENCASWEGAASIATRRGWDNGIIRNILGKGMV